MVPDPNKTVDTEVDMIVYLIRHGETDYNRQQRYQGHTDIELNEVGRRQAKELAKQLDFTFDEVIASPLHRAVETAAILSGFEESRIRTDDRIKEIYLGKYEGRQYRDVDEEFRKFFDAPESYVGVGGAESFESLFARVEEFLLELIKRYAGTEKKILVASHGAAIHAMLGAVNHLEREDFWKIPVDNCTMIPLKYEERSGLQPDVGAYRMLAHIGRN